MKQSTKDAIKGFAPWLATLLGGPAAGKGVQLLSQAIFGRDNASESEIEEAVEKGLPPETIEKIRMAQIALDTLREQGDQERGRGQVELNRIDARSGSFFKSGWRPAAGWTCVSGLFYAGLIEPIMRFVAAVMFKYAGAFPEIDAMLLINLLLALLGLGGMRSWERGKGKS